MEPLPASRPRVTKWGAYIAKPYKTWLAEAAAYLKTVRDVSIPREHLKVSVEIVCTRARTSKLTTPKGDIDNYVKAPLDAISHAGLWDDDKWVTTLVAHKRFAAAGESACTRVLVFVDR
jgi:Holliday junction resolvase RusA-like endonuclease